jgi:AmmeMemoRadiSam system protein B
MHCYRYLFLFSLTFIFLFFWFYFSPQAIVIPHHNIVADTRSNFLSKFHLYRPFTKKIIVLGPDHFSINQKQISLTDTPWSLSDSQIPYDRSFDSSGLTDNNQLLKNDHTIYNLLLDIEKFFPHATLVPILIGQKLSPSDLEPLYQKINNYCHFDCLLIASVDFSHYLPASLAEVHDSYTLDALYSKNFDKILSAEVDSPQSLYLVSRFAKEKKLSFSLTDHTNSGTILKNPDIETTTHFFASFSKKFVSLKKPPVSTKLELPFSINRSRNLNTLGNRFFYGVDQTIITPNPNNFAVTTIKSQKITTQAFFPLIKVGDTVSFVRGDVKRNLIKNYFDSITDKSMSKDYFWGTLTYESKN